ncbi:MAG: serine/threonine protein kinase [Deltaproteobacteria bacterium]|nr:serine/threonine protein kinase [Deltaproteobacteria bacterium]
MSAEQFGPYLVYEELGVGGMATVHRAEIRGVEGFSKPVALKRMHPYLASSPETVKAFVREAQLASQLHHGNIAQTYELGKANGTYFISMEYIPGPTLTQVIRQCQLAAGAIPIRITIGILLQLCDALDYAHNRTDDEGHPLGIIHRDVSPSNIVISNTGIVKLLDFGIAKVTSKVETDTPLTGMTIKGKFDYIAPEYLGGQLDVRADLFAVGVIAHELLTGRKLFAGKDDFETMTLVLEMPIHPPSRLNTQVPHELDHIVMTALQRDPAKRWQSANALHQALMVLGHQSQALATHQEIFEWVQWAYTQVRSEGARGELERVIEMLDQPSSVEVTLTPDQRRELDEFAQPVETLAGVGSVSARPANPSMLQLSQARVSMDGRTPMIAFSEPIKKRPSQAQAQARPSAGLPVQRDEDSGLLLVQAQPKRRSRWGIVGLLLILLVAAGAGVLAAAYLFDIELPLIGRW